MNLPSMRTNRATFAVPTEHLPAVAQVMLEALPPEEYDPGFLGQELATIYFDTAKQELRKNRRKHQKYITVRLRGYRIGAHSVFFTSAKTETEKYRCQIDKATAATVLAGNSDILALFQDTLPPHLFARLIEISHEQPLLPATCIKCRRYAREDDDQRLTLDVHVRTDTDKSLSYNVLEFKSIDPAEPMSAMTALPIRPIRLSKFIWATDT